MIEPSGPVMRRPIVSIAPRVVVGAALITPAPIRFAVSLIARSTSRR
jgi:hypothetical protein